MQLRLLLAGLAGGAVMFLWGFVFWAVLPFPKTQLPALPDEDRVLAALDEALPASGTYFFPSRTEANHESMKARYAERRVGMIAFHKSGVDMEDPAMFLKGFLHFAACATIAAGIMGTVVGSLPTYGSRALFVFRLGLFAGVAIEIAKSIWFHAPNDFILLNLAFHFVGWGLAGLAIAGIVKPKVAGASA